MLQTKKPDKGRYSKNKARQSFGSGTLYFSSMPCVFILSFKTILSYDFGVMLQPKIQTKEDNFKSQIEEWILYNAHPLSVLCYNVPYHIIKCHEKFCITFGGMLWTKLLCTDGRTAKTVSVSPAPFRLRRGIIMEFKLR